MGQTRERNQRNGAGETDSDESAQKAAFRSAPTTDLARNAAAVPPRTARAPRRHPRSGSRPARRAGSAAARPRALHRGREARALAADDDRDGAAQVGLVVAAVAVGGRGVVRTPRAARRASASSSERPLACGRRKALPIEPRSAFHESGSAVPVVSRAPLAPAASALRRSAPTLPGSCTPSITSTSGAAAARPARRPKRAARRARAIPAGLGLGERRDERLRHAPDRTPCSASAASARAPRAVASARGDAAASTSLSPAPSASSASLGPSIRHRPPRPPLLLERPQPLVERVCAAPDVSEGGIGRERDSITPVSPLAASFKSP